MDYNELVSIIPNGKKNAIHLKELANTLGVTCQRAKYLVRRARLEGVAIVSGSDGYWFASDKREEREFVAKMYRQGLSRLRTVAMINDLISQIDGQISIEESMVEALGTMPFDYMIEGEADE